MLRSPLRSYTPSPLSVPSSGPSHLPSPPRRWSCLPWHRQFKILAIETSCDDTCVAILDLETTPSKFRRTKLLFNEKITSDNIRYGGIHPLRSMQSHHATLAPLVSKALKVAKIDKPDLVAVTKGPGMRNNLQSGIDVAKGLSAAWRVPLVGVHHMQAHALTSRMHIALSLQERHFEKNATDQTASRPAFPFLSLLVSGGHTLLVHSSALTEHRILASTVDIAIGDCLDKIARLVLPRHVVETTKIVSYGSLLEAFGQDREAASSAPPPPSPNYDYSPPLTLEQELRKSRERNQYGWYIPAPFLRKGAQKSKSMEFSFAGLAAHVERVVKYGGTHNTPREVPMPLDEARDLAKAAMESAFEHLANRICMFLDPMHSPFEISGSMSMNELEGKRDMIKSLVLGGGVAANFFLRHILKSYLAAHNVGHVKLRMVPSYYCTDNAAMIAWTAAEMVGATTAEAGFMVNADNFEQNMSMRALRKWSLENLMTPEKEEEREMKEEEERDRRQHERAVNQEAKQTVADQQGDLTAVLDQHAEETAVRERRRKRTAARNRRKGNQRKRTVTQDLPAKSLIVTQGFFSRQAEQRIFPTSPKEDPSTIDQSLASTGASPGSSADLEKLLAGLQGHLDADDGQQASRSARVNSPMQFAAPHRGGEAGL